METLGFDSLKQISELLVPYSALIIAVASLFVSIFYNK
jgi:hypothetical protein